MTTDDRLDSIETRLDAIIEALRVIGQGLGLREQLERIADRLSANGRHATEPAPPMPDEEMDHG